MLINLYFYPCGDAQWYNPVTGSALHQDWKFIANLKRTTPKPTFNPSNLAWISPDLNFGSCSQRRPDDLLHNPLWVLTSMENQTQCSCSAHSKKTKCLNLFLMKTPLSEKARSSELWRLCNEPTSDQIPQTHWGKSQQWKLLHHIKPHYTLSHCQCPPLPPAASCVSKQTRVCRNMNRCDTQTTTEGGELHIF